MTTTELIKILQDNEKGAISHKSREISLTINGRYMINPQIKVSGTGDGICGAEIDLDINGEWLEQESCDNAISRTDMLNAISKEITSLPSELTEDGRRLIRRGDVFRIIEQYRGEEDGSI